jgi:hypothetical protein
MTRPEQATRRARRLVLLLLLAASSAAAQTRPEARPGEPPGLDAGGPSLLLRPDPAPPALPEEMLGWARTAWAYFAPPPPPAPAAPAPQGCCCGQCGQTGGEPPPPPPGPGLGLAPAVAGSSFTTIWSLGDELSALLVARRLGLTDARDFDRRLSRILVFLNTMPLAFGELPNRFYSTQSGAMLGPDLQEGLAGWSSVDTGRLLIWLRIAAEEHPAYAAAIRNAVGRWSTCGVLSERGHLQATTPGENGPNFALETARGYDAYAVQGYRAWGVDMPLPPLEPSPFEIEVGPLRLPVQEDVTNQAPVLTTPPAYLGLEFGFDSLGEIPEEVAGGREAQELLQAVHDIQERRWQEEGLPTARAEFRRLEEPYSVTGTVLANGYPWSVVTQGGAERPDLALVTTRGAFALDAFFDDAFTDTLALLVRDLNDPGAGWFEGRYEATGGIEYTRTSATNAFVLESIAHEAFGPLFPDAARAPELAPVTRDAKGACRLPLALP